MTALTEKRDILGAIFARFDLLRKELAVLNAYAVSPD